MHNNSGMKVKLSVNQFHIWVKVSKKEDCSSESQWYIIFSLDNIRFSHRNHIQLINYPINDKVYTYQI